MYDYKPKEAYDIMKKNGWEYDRRKGSHVIFKNDKGEHISLPVKHKCNGAIMHKLMKKHNLNLAV